MTGPQRFACFTGVLVAPAIGLTCARTPVPPAAGSDADLYGAVVPSDEEFATYPKALPASVLTGQTSVPATFQISATSLPPVQAQGTATKPGYPGSCEVWAAGYALGSYTANITNQQPISDLNHTVSAAFVYMWVLNRPEPPTPCGHGTAPAVTLNYLTAQSAPSLTTVPYQPNCTYLGTIDVTKTYTTNLKIGSWSALPNPTDPSERLTAIKGYVAESRIVEITMVVPLGFDNYNPTANGGVFNAPASCPSPTSPACHQHNSIACAASATTTTGCAQHGVAIVGYDDTMANPQSGQPGAVLIMNSFGPGWGSNGFMWMSYATLGAALLGAGIIAEPPPPTGSSPAITDAFQRVEGGGGSSMPTHLVFRTRLDKPIEQGTVTVTAPDGKAAVQQVSHAFRSGPLYVSRRDGRSFVPGLYTVRVKGTAGGGDPVDISLQGRVIAETGRPAAPFPADMTGTNGQLVW